MHSFDTINVGRGKFDVHVLNVFDCWCVSALRCWHTLCCIFELYNCMTCTCTASVQDTVTPTHTWLCGLLTMSVSLWWRSCWVLVSVSQMAARVSPCWRCLRTASPCHSPPSSQVSAGGTGGRGSTTPHRLFAVVVLLRGSWWLHSELRISFF